MSPNDPHPGRYEPEPNAPDPDELYLRWARARADRVLPRVAISAHGLAQAYLARQVNPDTLYTAGSEAAVTVMFELSQEVTEAVGNKITEAIMYRVAWEAMYSALSGDPVRHPLHRPLSEHRRNTVLGLMHRRLVVGGDRLLKASPACSLSVRAISAIGAAAASKALKRLPPAAGAALGDRALAVIGFYVGWAAMYAALEADLTRDPPGRQGSRR